MENKFIKVLPPILILCFLCLFYSINSLFFNDTIHPYVLLTFLDNKIPFVPQFICVYMLVGPFVLLLSLVQNRINYVKSVILLFSFITSSLVIHHLLPTIYTLRPHIGSISGWPITEFAVRTLYYLDKPYSTFPSIHVGLSTIMVFILFNDKGIRHWASLLSISLACLILASVLLVKQHYILDIVYTIPYTYILYSIILKPSWKIFKNDATLLQSGREPSE